jgi:predicted GNAT family N-acyltransferase
VKARYSVRQASWNADQDALQRIRLTVFVEEQGVPVELEWDGMDPDSVHFLAVESDGAAIGTVRLLPDGHIGRMAVLKPWRKQGVGHALLTRVLDYARARGDRKVMLNAQTTAVEFYRREGFAVIGNEFMDAGIPHLYMEKTFRDGS